VCLILDVRGKLKVRCHCAGTACRYVLNVSLVESGQAKNIMEDSGLTSGIQPKGMPVRQSNYSKQKQRWLINPHINHNDDDQNLTSVLQVE